MASLEHGLHQGLQSPRVHPGRYRLVVLGQRLSLLANHCGAHRVLQLQIPHTGIHLCHFKPPLWLVSMAVDVLAAYLTLHFPGEEILIQYVDDVLLVSADLQCLRAGLRAPARHMVVRLILCPSQEDNGVQGTSQTTSLLHILKRGVRPALR